MKKRICSSGADRGLPHRGDFVTCPNCEAVLKKRGEWDYLGVTLVLEPAHAHVGCVAVVAECSKCFTKSWIHEGMDCFKYNDAWPEGWKEAVAKHAELLKLNALRGWGRSICHQCKHLQSGTVDYHAWRSCKKGSGPAVTKCDIFQPEVKIPLPTVKS